jgi:hypothetical protein
MYEITHKELLSVKHLLDTTDLTIEQIAKQLSISVAWVRRHTYECYSSQEFDARKKRLYALSKTGDKNPMTGKFKELHPNWKGGDVLDGKGYVITLKPTWYTGRKGSKYVFKHSVVMCEALGLSEMPAGMIVHHIDGNPLNNSLDNLQMMTPSAHTRLHQLERATTIRKE